jgi:ribosomal protein L12E/L44/L45/RPP1/RPP2
MTSVGSLILHDPTEYDTGQALTEATTATVDVATLAAIARESEIDFDELVTNINATIAAAGYPVSVSEVLAAHPATQGVASVIGLVSLAVTHGEVDEDRTDEVAWEGLDGVPRRAVIDRYVFKRSVDA